MVKLIIAAVSQCFPYNPQQFPNVLQRYFQKAKFLMLQLVVTTQHQHKMLLCMYTGSKAISGLDWVGYGMEISECTSAVLIKASKMHVVP